MHGRWVRGGSNVRHKIYTLPPFSLSSISPQDFESQLVGTDSLRLSAWDNNTTYLLTSVLPNLQDLGNCLLASFGILTCISKNIYGESLGNVGGLEELKIFRSDLMTLFGNLPCYGFSILVSVGMMMFLGKIVLQLLSHLLCRLRNKYGSAVFHEW